MHEIYESTHGVNALFRVSARCVGFRQRSPAIPAHLRNLYLPAARRPGRVFSQWASAQNFGKTGVIRRRKAIGTSRR